MKKFFFLIWVLTVCACLWRLSTYSNTPGNMHLASQKWPTNSHLLRTSEQGTLVIFAHPRCPCSRASVGELERLMPQINNSLRTYVVFVKPKNLSEDWPKESLWKKAESIPNVQVVLDDGGIEADRFKADTSGQTYLYDKNGDLVFAGGITPARGHMGENLGTDAIQSFLEGNFTQVIVTPVFGCALKNPERAFASEEHHDHHAE